MWFSRNLSGMPWNNIREKTQCLWYAKDRNMIVTVRW